MPDEIDVYIVLIEETAEMFVEVEWSADAGGNYQIVRRIESRMSEFFRDWEPGHQVPISGHCTEERLIQYAD